MVSSISVLVCIHMDVKEPKIDIWMALTNVSHKDVIRAACVRSSNPFSKSHFLDFIIPKRSTSTRACEQMGRIYTINHVNFMSYRCTTLTFKTANAALSTANTVSHIHKLLWSPGTLTAAIMSRINTSQITIPHWSTCNQILQKCVSEDVWVHGGAKPSALPNLF